jgi:hypothetical protein
MLAHMRKYGAPLNFTGMSPSNSTESCIGFGPKCEDWLECGQAVSFQVTLTSRNEYLFSRPPVLDSNGTLSFTVRLIATSLPLQRSCFCNSCALHVALFVVSFGACV